MILPHDDSVLLDPSVQLLLKEVQWFLCVRIKELNFADKSLGARAYLNKDTVSRLRSQTNHMLNGADYPLFPWPVLAALAWAAAPEPATLEFTRWFEKLYQLYRDAEAVMPRKYGTTTEQRIAAKKYSSVTTTDTLQPLPTRLRPEISERRFG